MSETHRDINKIDQAGQKDLWDRPRNPGAPSGKNATQPKQDTKAQTDTTKTLPTTKSLTEK